MEENRVGGEGPQQGPDASEDLGAGPMIGDERFGGFEKPRQPWPRAPSSPLSALR
jgi:hypothetical protein